MKYNDTTLILLMIAIATLVLVFMGYFTAHVHSDYMPVVSAEQGKCERYYDITCDAAGHVVDHVHDFVK